MSLECQLEIIELSNIMKKQDLNDLPNVRVRILSILRDLAREIKNNKTITDNWKKEMLNSAIHSFKSNNGKNYIWLFACITDIALFYTDEDDISELSKFNESLLEHDCNKFLLEIDNLSSV